MTCPDDWTDDNDPGDDDLGWLTLKHGIYVFGTVVLGGFMAMAKCYESLNLQLQDAILAMNKLNTVLPDPDQLEKV